MVRPLSALCPRLCNKLSSVNNGIWVVLAVIIFLTAVVCAVFLSGVADTQTEPLVSTHCGYVKGRLRDTIHNLTITEFLYIPYAVPPLAERRWTHSELLSDDTCWSGVYSADLDRGIKCVQAGKSVPVKGVEDCLHLSVRTPNISGTLPVLVWIHGGALQYGSAEDTGYSADTEFTAALNVVTVNINYRLDVLGFLSLPELWEDGQSYGNFGIHDAIVALKWVQKNIKNFGGDETQVTIMGESSGGTIAVGLILAPKADGLFKKAIALSSAPVWNATYQDAHSRRPDYLTKVGCAEDKYPVSSDRKSCLKNATLETLITNVNLSRGWGFYDFPLSEGMGGESMDYNVIEPYVIPYPPSELATKPTPSATVQLILSNTAQEVGYYAFISGYNKFDNWTIVEATTEDRLMKFQNSTDLLDDIKTQYSFGTTNETWWAQLGWDTLTTDVRATCPTNSLVEEMNKSSRVEAYRMYIKHRPSSAVGEKWDSWHGWDTETMFDFKYYKGDKYFNTSQHDHKLKEQLRSVISLFCHDEIRDWSPTKTIVLENSEPWTRLVAAEPQSDKCTFWFSNGFEGWGWQN